MDNEEDGNKPDLIIDGSIAHFDGKDFTFDREKKIIQTKFDTYNYVYDSKNQTITFDGDTYAKVGGSKYKEVLAEIKENKKD